MGKKEIKTAIFERGTEACRRLFNVSEDVYICPICRKGFNRHALDDGVLTLEHIPPESIGGKGILLTCWKCNSSAGTMMDSQIKIRQNHFLFFDAIKNIDQKFHGMTKATFENIEMNMEFEYDNNTQTISLTGKGNSPENIRRFIEYMNKKVDNSTWNGSKFHLSPSRDYDFCLAKVGDLRIAYLLCFALFGYSYIFSKSLVEIWNQIRNPTENILNNYWIILGRKYYQENIVLLVDHPEKMIFVGFGYYGVFLPRLSGEANIYNTVLKNIDDGAIMKVNGTRYYWPEKFILAYDFRALIGESDSSDTSSRT